MEAIIRGSGTGKTKELLMLAKEQNCTVFCENSVAMYEKAHAYGIVGLNILDYGDLEDFLLFNPNSKIVIDEIEQYFNWANHTVLVGFTATKD